MSYDKIVLKKLFEEKSLDLLTQLDESSFITTAARKLFSWLKAYVKKTHKIPSIDVFQAELEKRLPKDKKDSYISYLESLKNLNVDISLQEALQNIKEQHLFLTLDENIKNLVEAAKERDTDRIIHNIHSIIETAINTKQLPIDIITEKYEPERIKTIDPFLPSMNKRNLKFGGVTLIGSGTGMGKSIFTLNQLLYSYKQGYNVCLLNLELSKDETIARMYATENNVPFKSIYGNTDPTVVEKVEQWKQEFFNRENKFYLYNEPVNAEELELIIRSMHAKGVEVFGLDYIQLVESAVSQEEWKSLSKLVKTLHRLTQELKIVIITPVQINLSEVKEKNNEIKLTVRGSRELEFSSTVFLFIYQTPEEYKEKMARIFTIKARNAEKHTYVVKTKFSEMKFEDTGIVL